MILHNLFYLEAEPIVFEHHNTYRFSYNFSSDQALDQSIILPKMLDKFGHSQSMCQSFRCHTCFSRPIPFCVYSIMSIYTLDYPNQYILETISRLSFQLPPKYKEKVTTPNDNMSLKLEQMTF